jgi:hypothetical protein
MRSAAPQPLEKRLAEILALQTKKFLSAKSRFRLRDKKYHRLIIDYDSQPVSLASCKITLDVSDIRA